MADLLPASAVLWNATIAAAVSTGLAAALAVQSWAVHREILPRKASRKSGHMALGLGLLLTWLLYQPGGGARWWAAVPPLLLALAFAAMGLGRVGARRVVRAVARDGDPRELLLGPLLYSLSFAAITVIFWRDSPVGITALTCLILGDGMAEVTGKGLRSPPLPWNRGKSVAGTVGALVASWFGGLVLLGVFSATGYLVLYPLESAGSVLAVAAVGAMLESLPWGPWDNLVVVWGCAVAGVWIF